MKRQQFRADDPKINRIIKLRVRWSTNDDKFLFNQIKNGGHKNIRAACEFVAVNLKRSARSVEQRWFMRLSKKSEIAYASGSSEGMLINRKVVSRKDGEMRPYTMKPMLYVISEMLKLSPKERDLIFELFKQ